MTTSSARYTIPAVVLHWLTALLVFILFGLGWYMVDLPKGAPARGEYFSLHKTLGISVFLLSILRLAWRGGHPPPLLPESVSRLQQRIAHWQHVALYVMLFLHPFTGYLSTQFAGHGTRYLGLALPQWGWKDTQLNELFNDFHEATAVALLILIVVHLLGAAAHMLKRDGLLRRMMLR